MGRAARSEVTLLAIHALVPGRTCPVWKVSFSNGQTLSEVVRCWAKSRLGIDVSTEVPGGTRAMADLDKELDLGSSVGSLRQELRVRQGAFTLTIVWPKNALPGALAAQANRAQAAVRNGEISASARSKLRRIHPSARYCHVDRRVMGWGSSSTQQDKIRAGTYADTRGHYPEQELAQAMRTPRRADGSAGEDLKSQMLTVFGHAQEVVFRARLAGPAREIANWEATCKRYEAARKSKRPNKEADQIPFPVFIPTRGRPEKAHLNWEAMHVFGKPKDEALPGSWPVVCATVEPDEEDAYREAWPLALMLVLPESNRGPGYSRWVVQQVCTRAFACEGDVKVPPRDESESVRRVARVWIADDTLTMFYKLVFTQSMSFQRVKRPKRIKRRVANGGPMFLEAMLAVQQHPFIARAAVAGFLRDDGTAVCKRNDWKLDEMALYKVVLLNLQELWQLDVEYMRDLQMYEDISLNHEVLSKGGRTLKCQCYGFRAVHKKVGGCLQQRSRRGGTSDQTSLTDLVPLRAFKAMSIPRQKAVEELLQWVNDKEKSCKAKTAKEARKDADAAGGLPAAERSFLKEQAQEVMEVSSDDNEVEAAEADEVKSLAEGSSDEDFVMTTSAESRPLRWGRSCTELNLRESLPTQA
eukprot:TRINITY_DN26433_c0_g1_i1.p1 TRINITY_DN26433_c0_g1~~TRINITY_DN26433_c0_g1_i1.p1  ORF type:complete len:641 (-),score=144.01 TRINITY_DN26433_c0_g1_i1:170-2092(-)